MNVQNKNKAQELKGLEIVSHQKEPKDFSNPLEFNKYYSQNISIYIATQYSLCYLML